MPEIRLFLLGSPRVECDGTPVEFDTRKATALLAYLALNRKSHSRDTLAALLWSEYSQTSARAALRRTLSTLRAALEVEVLAVNREQIGLLDDAPLWSDVDEFNRALNGWQQHGHRANETCPLCLPDLRKAVSLYRDDFMAGFTLRDSPGYDDWQFFQSEQYRRSLASALERLVQVLEADGQYRAAIDYAQRWLALDPLHEPVHRQLMTLYALNGERNAALRQFRECTRILDEELGVEPVEETAELYQTIKDNRLTAPERTSAPLVMVEANLSPAVVPGASPGLPLVGRADELRQLGDAFVAVSTDGFLAVVEGEAGIGKTRLAETFLAGAQTAGSVILSARCYQGESQLAYAPFADALRDAVAASPARWWQDLPDAVLSEAARLLPELMRLRPGLPPPLPVEDPAAQTRFFEATLQLILAVSGIGRPGVLFFDDAQWADDASLDLLTYLVRRLHGRPVFVLATWRSSDVDERHRLRQLFAETRRAGRALMISLERLSLDDVRNLALSSRVGSAPLPAEMIQQLYSETEGLPFFVVEYLAALPESSANGQTWTIPGTVRDLLLSRLAQLDEVDWQVMQASAVIGRWFDFDTLREVSGRGEEETISAVEGLLNRRLFIEIAGADPAGPAYDFSHEKLREVVYEEISQLRRRLLHQRVASALVSRSRQNAAPLAGQIAHHLELASVPAEAARYHLLAGDHARALFANREAMRHYQAALRLSDSDSNRVNEAIADLLVLSGEYNQALAHFSALLAQPALASADRARILHKSANVLYRRGDRQSADQHYQQAAALLQAKEDTARRAYLYADWSRNAHDQGNAAQASQLADQALRTAGDSGDLQALAHAHNILGVLARTSGALDNAYAEFLQSLQLSETLNDLSATIAALNNLALVWGDLGDPQQAIDLAQKALELCTREGDRHREAALHNNLADLFHAAGDPEHAMQHLRAAVTIFSEVGIKQGSAQPEIWKLTNW